jgi:hypothetical protein
VRTVTGVGRSLGAAVTGNRALENFEATPIVVAGSVLTAVAAVGFLAPWLLAWPVAFLAGWMGLTFLVEGWSLWRRKD